MLIAHATALTADDELARAHADALAAASGGRVVTLHAANEDAVADNFLNDLRILSPALVVVGTRQRRGLAALLHSSIGELIARNISAPTLFVQQHARGFVDEAGELALQRVIVPAGTDEDAEQGRSEATRFLARIGKPTVPVDLVRATSAINDTIVKAAEDASLVVMRTRGHDGLRDALGGSKTEHVIRHASCPVLSIPIPRRNRRFTPFHIATPSTE